MRIDDITALDLMLPNPDPNIGNVTQKNYDLGYNLSVAIPLYGFIRSISLDLINEVV